MRRRDSDPRPEVEVLGTGSDPLATQRIAVGGPGGGGSGGSGGSRGRTLLAATAVVALVFGGLVLGDDANPEQEPDGSATEDDGTTSTSRRTTTTRADRPARTTTTSTTTTLPAGPLLGAPTGGGLVLLGERARYVDLDTGAHHDVQLGGADYWSAVPVRGGVVTITGSGPARFVPVPEGDPVDLDSPLGEGRIGQVLAAGSPDRVWLLNDPYESEQPPRGVLVDLSGRALSTPVDLPGCCPIGGTDTGLVVSVGGRTYLVEPDAVRPVAEGTALGMRGRHLAVMACDDQARCRPDVIDLVTGTVRHLNVLSSDITQYGAEVVPSPEGHVAIVTWGPREPVLRVIRADGADLGDVGVSEYRGGGFGWLPGGGGLVFAGGEGVQRAMIEAGGLVVEPIPGLERSYPDGVLVVLR